MSTVYLFRHGTTHANTGGRFCGRSDVPLADPGGEASVRLPAADEYFSSPLGRCRAYMDCVPSYAVADELAEVDFGTWEGRTFTEIEKADPDAAREYVSSFTTFRFPQGESLADVLERTGIWLNNTLQPLIADGKDVCIVSHAGVITCLMLRMLALPDHAYTRFRVRNARITVIRADYSEKTYHYTLDALNALPKEFAHAG